MSIGREESPEGVVLTNSCAYVHVLAYSCTYVIVCGGGCVWWEEVNGVCRSHSQL